MNTETKPTQYFKAVDAKKEEYLPEPGEFNFLLNYKEEKIIGLLDYGKNFVDEDLKPLDKITHWLKPCNPVEALIEKLEKEIDEFTVRLKNAKLNSFDDIHLPLIIEVKKQILNDLKSI